ncbi:MAG: acyl-CoA dehydrogenase [SAR324 cluster bacterium]|nr:acyl-CoA dehydrogenase [SAR324 cluster bacterium]
MNSTEYSVDLRDIQFVQKELLGVQKLVDYEPFGEFSEEDFDMVLREGSKFAESVFATVNKIGDEQGSNLENGDVVTPEGFKETWRQYVENGWLGITGNPRFGGQGLPLSVAIGVMESLYGSNPALYTVLMLTAGAAGLINGFGDEQQKTAYCEKMLNGTWSGTMCLSESGAGSAVGDITTKAFKAGDGGHYLIKGTKQWISGGDHDMAENIIHMVLARVEGAPAGPKGISMFIVPKFRLDGTGQPGASNNVTTVRLEHKLGIKASPTAVLEFGGSGDCHGYLLEAENRGLAQMFKLMNEARLTIAYQGLGIASGAYRNALAYAREREQGIPIEQGKEQGAERVAIVHHPDVRNMLMTMKALVEGLRGLIYAVAYYNDLAHHGPEESRGRYQDLVDILIPVAKNAGADQGFEAVRLGMQVLGGVGYTEEFPLAQALRDTKIASIYEGTSGIQALDLVTRKLGMRGGELFQELLEEMKDVTPEKAKAPSVRQAIEHWQDSLEKLKLTVASVKNLAEELGPREAVFNATDITVFFGDVTCSYYLLKSALLAESRLEEIAAGNGDAREVAQDNEEARFYFNKIKTAEHYVFQILPRALSVAAKVQSRNFAALEAVL